MSVRGIVAFKRAEAAKASSPKAFTAEPVSGGAWFEFPGKPENLNVSGFWNLGPQRSCGDGESVGYCRRAVLPVGNPYLLRGVVQGLKRFRMLLM